MPVLLVGRAMLSGSPATRDWLAAHGAEVSTVYLLGGPDVMPPTLQGDITRTLASAR